MSTDQYANLRVALAAEPSSAWYTHPRDDNKWQENTCYAQACEPAVIRALLAERDAVPPAPAGDVVPAQPTEDQWLGIAEACANLDWNCAQPDGYLDAIKMVGRAAIAISACPAAPAAVWRSHDSNDGMRFPEQSDLMGGATDCCAPAALVAQPAWQAAEDAPEGEEVLVYLRAIDAVTTSHRTSDGDWINNSGNKWPGGTVSHYMPLPAAPSHVPTPQIPVNPT